MNLTLIIAALFLLGALYNLFGPEPNITEGTAGIAISLALGGVYLFRRQQLSLNILFLAWLHENAFAVKSGGAVYDGILVTAETEITQYQIALSALLVSAKSPSRFYFVGHEPTLGIAVFATVVSLIFGWWGIPWGPVYTIQAASRNIRGGMRQRVRALLESIQPTEQNA